MAEDKVMGAERFAYRKKWDKAITATFLRFRDYIVRDSMNTRGESAFGKAHLGEPPANRDKLIKNQSVFLEDETRVMQLALVNEESIYGAASNHEAMWLLRVAPKQFSTADLADHYDVVIGYRDGDFDIESLYLLADAGKRSLPVVTGSNNLNTRQNVREVDGLFESLLDGAGSIAPITKQRFHEVDGQFTEALEQQGISKA